MPLMEITGGQIQDFTITNADIATGAAVEESKLLFDPISGHAHDGEDSKQLVFTSLSDAPSAYDNQSGKVVKVNADENALIFGDEGYFERQSKIGSEGISSEYGERTTFTFSASAMVDDSVLLVFDNGLLMREGYDYFQNGVGEITFASSRSLSSKIAFVFLQTMQSVVHELDFYNFYVDELQLADNLIQQFIGFNGTVIEARAILSTAVSGASGESCAVDIDNNGTVIKASGDNYTFPLVSTTQVVKTSFDSGAELIANNLLTLNIKELGGTGSKLKVILKVRRT